MTQPPQNPPVVEAPGATSTTRPVPVTTKPKAAPRIDEGVPGAVPAGPTSVEVNIGEQRLLLYKDGKLFRSVHVSTGSGRHYCEKGKCGVDTPRGRFRIYTRIAGWRTSQLGKLYNPLYFSGGYAIHGAGSVPNYPASHGCIRISIATANWLPRVIPNGTPVWVHD